MWKLKRGYTAVFIFLFSVLIVFQFFFKVMEYQWTMVIDLKKLTQSLILEQQTKNFKQKF